MSDHSTRVEPAPLAVCKVTEAPVVMLVADRTMMSASAQEVVTEPAKLTEPVEEPVAATVRLPQVPEVVTLLAK